MFQAGDKLSYTIGVRRNGKPMIGAHPVYFVRYAGMKMSSDSGMGERAIIRSTDPAHSGEEEEEWAIRLNPWTE